MPRPKGSRTDDYIVGVMCGLLYIMGPSAATYLARLAIKIDQVPLGGTEDNRVDRLARKILSGNYRSDTKEFHDGFGLMRALHNQMDPKAGRL